MRFVDRIQEKERLTKILNMDRPTFTAIYGRADVVMEFTQIKLPYLQEALNLTPEQAIEEYSV